MCIYITNVVVVVKTKKYSLNLKVCLKVTYFCTIDTVLVFFIYIFNTEV